MADTGDLERGNPPIYFADEAFLFNTKSYATAEEALVACRTLWGKKCKIPASTWSVTDVVVDAKTSEFSLRCATCKAVFSSYNPSTFGLSTRRRSASARSKAKS